MKKPIRSKRNSGFSLVEVLAVVGILVILLAISIVPVANYKDKLKITELDNAAREIFMAAQNRAVLLYDSQQLDGYVNRGVNTAELLGYAQHSKEEDEEELYYLTSRNISELLGPGSIDSAFQRDNVEFYIVFDLKSGSVTDVFYAEKTDVEEATPLTELIGTYDDFDAFYLDWAVGRSERLLKKKNADEPEKELLVGWYDGKAAQVGSGGGSEATPFVNVNIENDEILTVTVNYGYSIRTTNFNETDQIGWDGMNLSVRLGNSNFTNGSINLNDESAGTYLYRRSEPASSYTPPSLPDADEYYTHTFTYTYSWVLDCLWDRSSLRNVVGDNLTLNGLGVGGNSVSTWDLTEWSGDPNEWRFSRLAGDAGVTPGENFQVKAEVTLGDITKDESKNGNSLFWQISGRDVFINCLRHLQNLDADGGYGSEVNKADITVEQRGDINGDGNISVPRSDDPSTTVRIYNGYDFKPISNDEIIAYKGMVYEIENLNLYAAGSDSKVGLFETVSVTKADDTVKSEMTLSNICMANTTMTVNGTADSLTVGFLAGEARDADIINCEVYWDAGDSEVDYDYQFNTGNSTDSIIGGLVGSATNGSISGSKVYWTGTTTKSNNMYTFEGHNVGGLAGTTDHTDIRDCEVYWDVSNSIPGSYQFASNTGANGSVGGLVGFATYGLIEDSSVHWAGGNGMAADYSYHFIGQGNVGGLAGMTNRTEISDSSAYWTGKTGGTVGERAYMFSGVNVGGLVGYAVRGNISGGSVYWESGTGGTVGEDAYLFIGNNVGGLVGRTLNTQINNNSTVHWDVRNTSTNAYQFYSNATDSNIGGLVGLASGGSIGGSTVSWTVGNAVTSVAADAYQFYSNATDSNVGGLAGQAHDTTISGSEVYWLRSGDDLQNVLGSDGSYNYKIIGDNAGGLVGLANGTTTIGTSLAASTVHGETAAGGLVGEWGATSISQSYADCYLSGSGNVAGLVGNATTGVSLENSYAAGFIISSGTDSAAGLCRGAGTTSAENVYSVVLSPTTDDDGAVTYVSVPLTQGAFTSTGCNNYFLGDEDIEDAGVVVAHAVSSEDLITAGSAGQEFLSKASVFETKTASDPYKLQSGLYANEIYPYPGLTALDHYCDWGAYAKPEPEPEPEPEPDPDPEDPDQAPEEITAGNKKDVNIGLVYYEKYFRGNYDADGNPIYEYAFYGIDNFGHTIYNKTDDGRIYMNTITDSSIIVESGYCLAYLKGEAPASNFMNSAEVTVGTDTHKFNQNEYKDKWEFPVVERSFAANAGEDGDIALGADETNDNEVNGSGRIMLVTGYPLTATGDFYNNTCRVVAHWSSNLGKNGGTFYFNSDFAKTVRCGNHNGETAATYNGYLETDEPRYTRDYVYIRTPGQLAKINDYLDGGYNFYLDMGNLDLSRNNGAPYTWNTPIGSESTPFTKRFEGGGHTISNLPYTQYLFDCVGAGSTVQFLNVRTNQYPSPDGVGIVQTNNGTVRYCKYNDVELDNT